LEPAPDRSAGMECAASPSAPRTLSLCEISVPTAMLPSTHFYNEELHSVNEIAFTARILHSASVGRDAKNARVRRPAPKRRAAQVVSSWLGTTAPVPSPASTAGAARPGTPPSQHSGRRAAPNPKPPERG